MAERRSRRAGVARLQPLVPLAVAWSVGFAVLIGVVLQGRVPYDELLLDPNNLAGVPWYTGLVSNLGILGWTTASVAGFFGAWIAHYGRRPAAGRMLLEGAVLSTVLLFDDLLQLHVLARPLLGVPKSIAYLVYLLLAAHWVLTQRRELARTRYELVVAAGLAFAASVGVDQVPGVTSWLDPGQRLLVEDAAKFLGVLAWAQFFLLTTGAIVTSIVGDLRAAADRAAAAWPPLAPREPRRRPARAQDSPSTLASSSSSSA